MRAVIIFVLIVVSMHGFSQMKRYGKNIPSFHYKNWHFGTMLGVNTSNYNVSIKPNPLAYDSITHINIISQPGMAIHIPLVSYNAHETFHFRFLPSLSFHETAFEYTSFKNGRREISTARVEQTNLNFPLFIKGSTKRINNFSAYALGGVGYSIDLASQADVDPNLQDPIVKLKKHEFQYHVGGGFDFYLPYFKFGLEIKTSRGINNILIQDNTFYSAPLESLKSRVWWFSITFEG